VTGLTTAEDEQFKATSFDSLQDYVRLIQQEQEQNRSMMYMKRLEPFLVSMKGYMNVVEDAEIFDNISDTVAYLWVSDESEDPGKHLADKLLQGPMVYILAVSEVRRMFRDLNTLRHCFGSSQSQSPTYFIPC